MRINHYSLSLAKIASDFLKHVLGHNPISLIFKTANVLG